MGQIIYKVGDIKRIIKESSLGYKPVVGDKVKSEDAKNNSKSYKDSEKRAKDYDGGLKAPEKKELPKKLDGNRTLADLNPAQEPDKKNRERMEALELGYNSVAEMNNGNERAADFDRNKDIMKQFKDARDSREEIKTTLQKSGISASKYPDSVFKKNHLTEDAKPKTKKLTFKTVFINESQMLSRIPDEYKVDGQTIIMKDSRDNEYIVECQYSEGSGLIETNITGYSNKRVVNEQMERIKHLMDYKGTKTRMNSVSERVNESRAFGGLMDLARGKKQTN